MKNLLLSFPEQLCSALQIAQEAQLTQSKHPITVVLIAGLWWSGIAGTIIADRLRFHATIPVLTTKDYDLPARVDQHTLVIACSYSGNTEETLAVFEKAHQAGAHLVAISSGGKLQEFAKSFDLDYITLPSEIPPRAAIGYGFVQQLEALATHQIIDPSYIHEIQHISELLSSKQWAIQEEANNIAHNILNKYVVLYAASDKEWMAIRFRHDLNENSKVLCHHHVVPEMNHNELVWRESATENYAALRLRTPSDNQRSAYRIEINKEIISKYTPHQYEIRAQGSTYLEHVRYLIHLADRVSFYLAELEGIDALEVPVVGALKDALGKK